MLESDHQRTEAAHGNALDGSISTARRYAIRLLDVWDQVLNYCVLVPDAILGVNVEAVLTRGGHDDEFPNEPIRAHLADGSGHSAALELALAAEHPVQEVYGRKSALGVAIVGRGKLDRKFHLAPESRRLKARVLNSTIARRLGGRRGDALPVQNGGTAMYVRLNGDCGNHQCQCRHNSQCY